LTIADGRLPIENQSSDGQSKIDNRKSAIITAREMATK